MKRRTTNAINKADHAIAKQAGRSLQKRYSLPAWALFAILAVFIFSAKFPDPGSYYRQGPQQQLAQPIARPTQPPPLPPAPIGPGPTPGIDVSQWQHSIDWQLVKQSGIEFVIIKATESTAHVDPRFSINWEGAKAAGLLVSAYHVVQPHRPAATQAQHFLDTIADRQPDFPLALDVELSGIGNIGAIVEEIALIVEASDGRKPLLYTAQSFWGVNVGWAPGWSAYALWVADYDALVPAIPAGWDSYTMWQYSSTGSLSGIQGNVDLNVFVGDRAALLALGR